ncbi:DEAD/DEAH box helicase [Candidatus Gracilibacteria bacterium]|nr:DEAD/DEAH box helicase [Candidatus Gracilibacteria bacterium]
MTQSFADLGLSAMALEAIRKKGFEEPTEIQIKTIPLLLKSNQDVIAQAQTGTGKTATFGLVFADKLTPRKSKAPQAIVLAPTRELAVQVAEELNSLKGSKNFSIVPIYGGQSWGMQRKHLQVGVDIVVGTPGRVMDHLEKGTLKLDKIEYFVLDEADEMLNMGFIEDIETILEYVKKDRQMLLFSATMPARIAGLAKKYMKNPVSIKTEKDRIANNAVDQIYFEVSMRDKFETLCRIIDMEEEFYGIIFCRTKNDSDGVSKQLGDRGYRAEAFHGDITQDRREQILGNFRRRKTEILVATDVAARGIDVSDLTHVINYALPQNSESYVHRIGRTGRAGKTGKAITLVTPSEFRKLRMFEHHAKAEIQKKAIPGASEMVELNKCKIIRDMESILVESQLLKKYEKLGIEMFKDKEPQAIIAALLKYSFSEKLDEASYKTIQQGRGGQRSERGGRREDVGRPISGKFGTTRLFLTTGKQDGATVPKILRMIEKDFGVSGNAVGEIDIMDSYSFISVPFSQAEAILDAFHTMKKKGKFAPVRVERASQGKKGGGKGRGGSRKSSSRGKPRAGGFTKRRK